MLTTVIPSVRLEGASRDCWLKRLTPAIRRSVKGYEVHHYTPVECCGHFDFADRFWITLERWVDYSDHPERLRDIQRVTLLIKDSGEILESRRHPIERIYGDERRGEPAATAAPVEGGQESIALPEGASRPRRRHRKTGLEDDALPPSQEG